MANQTFKDVLKPRQAHWFVKDIAFACGISAIKANKILLAKGFQKKHRAGYYYIPNDKERKYHDFVQYIVGYNNTIKKTMVFTARGKNEAVRIIEEELHGV